MDSLLSISPVTALIIGVGALTILEVLFLYARIIENETALHNLKVRSHTLRLNMTRDAAMQMVQEWEYEKERTGKDWAEIINLKNRILDPVLRGEANDTAQESTDDDEEIRRAA